LKLVSVSEMQSIESEANACGLSYEMMMENAGVGMGKIVIDLYSHMIQKDVLGLVGTGNNGGDTLVAMEFLLKRGWKATAYIVGNRSEDDSLVRRFLKSGGSIFRNKEDKDFVLLEMMLKTHRLILDGILGTGFRLPLRSSISELLKFIQNSLISLPEKSNIVAVDCPSGVDCDSGEASEYCLFADYTVTMAAAKIGLVKFPAANLVGKLIPGDIGLSSISKKYFDIKRFIVTREWVQDRIPERSPVSHKGTYGTALVIAGSRYYPGAALLSGKAAYLSGVGLVTMATPVSIYQSLIGHFPEATWLPLPDRNGFISNESMLGLIDDFDRISCILAGPGFGNNEYSVQFIEKLLLEIKTRGKNKIGLVLDADGLKLLSSLTHWHKQLPEMSILTPHPGEMSILSKLPITEIQHSRIEIAERFAVRWGHILVLKGAFTVVASPDGNTAVIPVASAALARAGTGDVLAGLITGFRAQGIDAFDAAIVGAYIHAKAGLCIADIKKSNSVVMAGDILPGIESMMGTFDQLKKFISLI